MDEQKSWYHQVLPQIIVTSFHFYSFVWLSLTTLRPLPKSNSSAEIRVFALHNCFSAKSNLSKMEQTNYWNTVFVFIKMHCKKLQLNYIVNQKKHFVKKNLQLCLTSFVEICFFYLKIFLCRLVCLLIYWFLLCFVLQSTYK